MDFIRVQNLKSIKDSSKIDLKAITILIGKNSSGKSTFARTFPLLKQSVSRNLSSPILWYGDYVDFGSFKNSLCETHDESLISFSFGIRVSNKQGTYFYKTQPIDAEMTFKVNDQNIEKILFTFKNKHRISLILDETKNAYDILIDDKNFFDKNVCINNGTLFPEITKEPFYYFLEEIFTPTNYLKKGDFDRFDLYKSIRSQNFNYSYIFDEEKTIALAEKMLNSLELNENSKTIFNNYLQLISNNLRKMLVLDFVKNSFICFRDEISSVVYFQPIRSRGDRFYRIQGLNVNEVESDGSNAPMILYSFDKERKKSFDKWCNESFGFRFEANDFNGNAESASIEVVESTSGKKHNLTDVGFGYSQILPIVLALWIGSRNKISPAKKQLIILEQPELHLHPGFQKRMMKTILNVVRESMNKETPINFIIETHSETIINFICRQIDNKVIAKENVNLLVFNKKGEETSIEPMILDDNGVISNWPIGFFSED